MRRRDRLCLGLWGGVLGSGVGALGGAGGKGRRMGMGGAARAHCAAPPFFFAHLLRICVGALLLLHYSLSRTIDACVDGMTASRAVETALRSGNAPRNGAFPSSQMAKSPPGSLQESICSPPSPPQKNTPSFFGDPGGGAYNKEFYQIQEAFACPTGRIQYFICSLTAGRRSAILKI